MAGLFDEQESAELQATWPVIDGFKLSPLHAPGYRVLRQVLTTLTPLDCKAAIEEYDEITTILAVTAMGLLLPMSLGVLVRQNWKQLDQADNHRRSVPVEIN